MMPVTGTELAAKWDVIWNFLMWMSVFFFILVVGGMVYLVIRYRASNVKRPLYLTGIHWLEAVWTIIPTLILVALFGWGYFLYNNMTQAPSDAYEVRVIGKQWLWQFQYDDGRQTTNEVYVPIN